MSPTISTVIDLLAGNFALMQIHEMTIQLKIIKNYSKLTPRLRTPRGTDEAAAESVCQQLSDNQFYNIFRKFIKF